VAGSNNVRGRKKREHVDADEARGGRANERIGAAETCNQRTEQQDDWTT